MIIESTVSLPSVEVHQNVSHWLPKAMGTIITLVITAALLLFVISPNLKPTGSLLSPLPEGEIAESPYQTQPTAPQPIIAAPEVKEASSASQVKTDANAEKLMIILPANTKEFVVRDQSITTNSYIYLTPISAVNDPIFVKVKGEGYFIVATLKASTADLLLEYYVIND